MIPCTKLKKLILDGLIRCLDINLLLEDTLWTCCYKFLMDKTESSFDIIEIKEIFFNYILPELSFNNFGYPEDTIERIKNITKSLIPSTSRNEIDCQEESDNAESCKDTNQEEEDVVEEPETMEFIETDPVQADYYGCYSQLGDDSDVERLIAKYVSYSQDPLKLSQPAEELDASKEENEAALERKSTVLDSPIEKCENTTDFSLTNESDTSNRINLTSIIENLNNEKEGPQEEEIAQERKIGSHVLDVVKKVPIMVKRRKKTSFKPKFIDSSSSSSHSDNQLDEQDSSSKDEKREEDDLTTTATSPKNSTILHTAQETKNGEILENDDCSSSASVKTVIRTNTPANSPEEETKEKNKQEETQKLSSIYNFLVQDSISEGEEMEQNDSPIAVTIPQNASIFTAAQETRKGDIIENDDCSSSASVKTVIRTNTPANSPEEETKEKNKQEETQKLPSVYNFLVQDSSSEDEEMEQNDSPIAVTIPQNASIFTAAIENDDCSSFASVKTVIRTDTSVHSLEKNEPLYIADSSDSESDIYDISIPSSSDSDEEVPTRKDPPLKDTNLQKCQENNKQSIYDTCVPASSDSDEEVPTKKDPPLKESAEICIIDSSDSENESIQKTQGGIFKGTRNYSSLKKSIYDTGKIPDSSDSEPEEQSADIIKERNLQIGKENKQPSIYDRFIPVSSDSEEDETLNSSRLVLAKLLDG